MVRKIIKANDPRLRKTSKPVKRIDKKIRSLIADMKETLLNQKNPEGVGLAAPQIGKNLQIFVVNHKNLKRVVINPQVIRVAEDKKKRKGKGKSKQNTEIMEGCLSIPHFYGPLKRPGKITIKYLTEEGKEKVETFTGFPAQIIQHEIDHLKGILFTDRLLEAKKPLYKVEGDRWEEVKLV